MPKFQNMLVWQQAETLMQPAFIRLVANIGKQLEQSSWKGQYEDIQVWPEGTDEQTRALVTDLRNQLEGASGDRVDEIQQTLSTLPSPYPGHQLCLSYGSNQFCVDLWELCYRICFRDYDVETGTSRNRGFGKPPSEGVEVDVMLFDETGDVDWNRLDEKAQKVVDQVFKKLQQEWE